MGKWMQAFGWTDIVVECKLLGFLNYFWSVIHVTHACHVHEVTAVALHVQYSIFSISVTAIEQARPLVQAVTYRDAALAVT